MSDATKKQVGAYEAKTHLPALLRRVEGGERITITRHGVPVARGRSALGRPFENSRTSRPVGLWGLISRYAISSTRAAGDVRARRLGGSGVGLRG